MSQPSKSLSTHKGYIKRKENYNKLSAIEKLEYDLKKMEQDEKNIKIIVRSKGYSSRKINKLLDNNLSKYHPEINYIKNTKYLGKDLISIRINENRFENLFFSVNTIQKISDKLSKDLYDNKVRGLTTTAMLYGSLNWKSGKLSHIGQKIHLYNPNELYNLNVEYEIPATIPSFNIYILLGNKAEGGNTEYNDCLYDCLKYYIFNIEDYFKTPADLKIYLKLGRNSKIPIDMLGLVEKKLGNKYQINVRGDYIRTSTIKSKKEINLLLENEHYTPEIVKRKYIPVERYKEKTIMMYDKKDFMGYNGKEEYKLTKEEWNNIRYNFDSPYILIPRDSRGYRDEEGNKLTLSLQEEYELTIKIAEILKKESNGVINMFKNGSYHDTSLSLFDKMIKYINAEPILQDETIWIRESSFSALIYAEEYEGGIYKYDVKSLYPYLMNLPTLKFPIKRGEFKKIDKFEQYPKFGIYKCIIKPSDDSNTNKLFKFNSSNKYSSIDIYNARNLGLEIELIQDEEINFLEYTSDKLITFNEVFSNYVKFLFALKDKKGNSEEIKLLNVGSKKILNILWGSLCEVDKKKYFFKNEISIDNEEEIISIKPYEDERGSFISIQTTKINNYYKTPFARLCPFLLSQGRKHMSEIMKPYKDSIKQIQTDGFSSTVKIHENRSVNIGELKFEGSTEEAIIKHCNSVNKVF
jgi:hypothetical protein